MWMGLKEALYSRIEDIVILFSNEKVDGSKTKHALFGAQQHVVSSTLHIWIEKTTTTKCPNGKQNIYWYIWLD